MEKRKGINEALQIAIKAHKWQQDRNGDHYIFHPMAVMQPFRFSGLEYCIAAVLHDVVEDSTVTIEEIGEKFGKEIQDIVDSLTRRDRETYHEFIARCGTNPKATLIKLSDIKDNTSPQRGQITPKYLEAKEILIHYLRTKYPQSYQLAIDLNLT
mgnify:CR=1 FL=1